MQASNRTNETELEAGCEVGTLEQSLLAKECSKIYCCAKLLTIKISLSRITDSTS